MITVTKHKSNRLEDVLRYLLGNEAEEEEEKKQRSREGYWFATKELTNRPGFFIGKLAERWGLADTLVTAEQFRALSEGRHPTTGEQLVAPARGTHTIGDDVTVSLPKSVSIAWASADAEGRRIIETEFEAAIRDTVAHIEAQAKLMTRKRPGTRENVAERADGIIVGAFAHYTSRPTEEIEVPDPQLHWHLFVWNLARRQDDKQARGGRYREYGAIEDRVLRTLKVEADGLIQANLMERLEAKGIKCRTSEELDHDKKAQERDTNREFFISGFESRDAIKAMSKRSVQVNANVRSELELKGFDPDKPVPQRVMDEAIEMAKVKGRRVKQVLPSDIFDRWQAQLAGFGISSETWLAAMGKKTRREPQREAVLAAALERIPEKGSVLPWWQLRNLISEEALRVGLSGTETKRLLDDAYAAEDGGPSLHDDLVSWQGKVTSRSWAAKEMEVVKLVAELAAVEAPSLSSAVDLRETELAVLARLNEERQAEGKDPISLGRDQAASLEAMWGKRVNLAQGQAGAGKTLAAQVLVEGHRRGAEAQGGRKAQIIAVSVAKERAVQFGRDIKADKTWSFEQMGNELSGKFGRSFDTNNRTLVVIDEACMADVARMRELLRLNREVSLLALGDPKQMQSIGAGGRSMWEHLEKVAGKAQVIDEIHRTQRDEWRGLEDETGHKRGAWENLRESETVDEAIAHYRKTGKLHFSPTDADAERLAMDGWEAKYIARGKHRAVALVADRSNEEIDRLNDEAAARLLAAGKLKGEGAKTTWQDPENRHYEREQMLFVGSYVGITKNTSLQQRDGQRFDLQNGERAIVKELERGDNGMATAVTLTIMRPSAPTVTLRRPEDIAALRQSWVTHTYREQGSTYEEVVVLQGHSTTNSSAYVAVTRPQHDVEIWQSFESLDLDPLEVQEADAMKALAAQWRRETEQESAISFVEAADAARAAYEAREAERQEAAEAQLVAETEEVDEAQEAQWFAEEQEREEDRRRQELEAQEARQRAA